MKIKEKETVTVGKKKKEKIINATFTQSKYNYYKIYCDLRQRIDKIFGYINVKTLNV